MELAQEMAPQETVETQAGQAFIISIPKAYQHPRISDDKNHQELLAGFRLQRQPLLFRACSQFLVKKVLVGRFVWLLTSHKIY